MKILGLIGSPRIGGNTDLLVDKIFEGSKSKGYSTEKIYIYDYNISLCTDCQSCKKGDYICCINDEMEKIYPKMAAADIIIFGTPLYWFGPTAKMKMLIDRLRPFVKNRQLEGKKAIVVCPSADGSTACGSLLDMFRLIFDYLKIKFENKILVTAYEKGEIAQNKEEMDKAFKLGYSF